MASRARSLVANAPGGLFVDDTCIDCAACRWIAPATFDAHDGASRVRRQPETQAERRRALLAVVACPTSSIGSDDAAGVAAAAAEGFPDPLDAGAGVHHCGYHARSSYGAASYLIVRDGGNVLVDSPRYAPALARRIEALGGARWMLLTHRDDVADHARWRLRLGCERVLHARDATFAPERVLEGDAPVALADDLLVLPVPGHTAGSVCLLYRSTFLFSGDHLAWGPSRGRLVAFRDACWHDWAEQRRSMIRLRQHAFSWVLPGHGHPVHLPAERLRGELDALVARMGRGAREPGTSDG